MVKCRGCRSVAPCSIPIEGKLGSDECVNELHVMRLHVCDRIPPVGIVPEILTPSAQTVTRHTKWPGADASHVYDIDGDGGIMKNIRYFHFPFPAYEILPRYVPIPHLWIVSLLSFLELSELLGF